MNNHWTFTELRNEEWAYDTFYSKEDTVSEGKKYFKGKDILIGQLKEIESGYKIENIEAIKVK